MRISDLQQIIAKHKRKHGNVRLFTMRYSDTRPMTEADVTIRSVRPVKGAAGEWSRSIDISDAVEGDEVVLYFEGN